VLPGVYWQPPYVWPNSARLMTRFVRSFTLAAVCGLMVVTGQTPAPIGSYTAVQAVDGRAAYQANCASCHLPDLAGRNEAPQLAGSNFMAAWGGRAISELLTYIQSTMPPGNIGSLNPETYIDLVAFLLEANGAKWGNQPLTSTTVSLVRSAATGQMPASLRQALRQATADQPTASQPSRPKGLTVKGEVKNYVPVSDEMLRSPDPGDWLMIRRNYEAWSYSPLTEITNKNVRDLHLAWVWAMNDGGANEPTPIVHNGIVYLSNTSNTVQALNGSTGDLIWENHIGPESTRAYGATRSLAIYQDKVFVATTDARSYALDARTGKIVWQTAIADPAKGYSNTSGPMVIHGNVVQGLMGCGQYQPAVLRQHLGA
jgi:alcohol dehydrogenase (cytochrome c)